MIKMARVWNDHKDAYSEEFKGKMIHINPHKFIEMEFDEAVLFLRKRTPIIQNAMGDDIKPKKLRMETFNAKTSARKVEPTFTCMVDGETFHTQKDYDKHVNDKHLDAIVDEKSREAFRESVKKAQSDLEDDLDGLA